MISAMTNCYSYKCDDEKGLKKFLFLVNYKLLLSLLSMEYLWDNIDQKQNKEQWIQVIKVAIAP